MEKPLLLGLPHPRHGTHAPTSGTPPRTPNSVRRTVTIDMLRPDGLRGPLVLRASGRDLLTGPDGTPSEVVRASFEAVVDFMGGWDLLELVTDPPRRALQELVGSGVGSGFRARIRDIDPQLPNLLHQLLDDVPVTTLVSGQAYSAARTFSTATVDGGKPQRIPLGRPAFGRNMCAGFVDGGTIMDAIGTSGRAPVVTGPVAPPIATSDPWGWHEMAPMAPHGMRRHRRMDVHDRWADVLFRDSYVRPDGVETVIHEYTVELHFDSNSVSSCVATPRVLPWLECPVAAESATRLAGVALADLRRHVRETFTGTSTCTHLNDTLRALEDLPHLGAFLGDNASDGD